MQTYDPKKPPAGCVDTYTQSQGYRRVPGNLCNAAKGLNYDPLIVTCDGVVLPPSYQPHHPPPPGHPGVVAGFIILLLLFVGFGVLWYLAGHNPEVRAYLEPYIPERFLPEISAGTLSGNYIPVSLDGDEFHDEDAKEVVLSEDEQLGSA